jgi:hypothetical protein
MKKINILITLFLISLLNCRADENLKLMSQQIDQEGARIDKEWDEYKRYSDANRINLLNLNEKAFDIEQKCYTDGKNYGVEKGEIYDSINDLNNFLIHKREKKENYEIIAKGIFTMTFNKITLPDDLRDIFKQASNKIKTSIVSHEDAVGIQSKYSELGDQECALKLKNASLEISDYYLKELDKLFKQDDQMSSIHDQKIKELNRKIDTYNALVIERKNYLDSKIQRINDWQMQQKLDEIKSKVDSIQMNQR